MSSKYERKQKPLPESLQNFSYAYNHSSKPQITKSWACGVRPFRKAFSKSDRREIS